MTGKVPVDWKEAVIVPLYKGRVKRLSVETIGE